MKINFATQQVSIELKGLEFAEPCLTCYSKKFQSDKDLRLFDDEISIHNWNEYSGETYSAPLWQQVVDWFRKGYGWQLCYNRLPHSYHYQFYFKEEGSNKQLTEGVTGKNGLYYEGMERAILKGIEKLKQ